MKKWTRVFFAQRHTRKIYHLLSLAFCAIFFSSYIRACLKRKMKLNYIDVSAYYKDCKTISGRTETLTRDSRRDAINIVITSFTADSTSTGEKNMSLKKYIQKNVDEKESGEELLMDSSSNLRCDNLRTFFKKVLKSVFKPCFKQYQSARATSKNGYSQMLWKGEKRYSRRLKWQLL